VKFTLRSPDFAYAGAKVYIKTDNVQVGTAAGQTPDAYTVENTEFPDADWKKALATDTQVKQVRPSRIYKGSPAAVGVTGLVKRVKFGLARETCSTLANLNGKTVITMEGDDSSIGDLEGTSSLAGGVYGFCSVKPGLCTNSEVTKQTRDLTATLEVVDTSSSPSNLIGGRADQYIYFKNAKPGDYAGITVGDDCKKLIDSNIDKEGNSGVLELVAGGEGYAKLLIPTSVTTKTALTVCYITREITLSGVWQNLGTVSMGETSLKDSFTLNLPYTHYEGLPAEEKEEFKTAAARDIEDKFTYDQGSVTVTDVVPSLGRRQLDGRRLAAGDMVIEFELTGTAEELTAAKENFKDVAKLNAFASALVTELQSLGVTVMQQDVTATAGQAVITKAGTTTETIRVDGASSATPTTTLVVLLVAALLAKLQ